MTRIFHTEPLVAYSEINLDASAYAHIVRVLRMKVGATFLLFDGSNRVFDARLIHIDKKVARARIGVGRSENRESPLHLHLGQVISRGEKMELTIQKSVELGVSVITPLFSERCGVKLSGERLQKRFAQWQQIAIAACEQCGRNQVPTLEPACDLTTWCGNLTNELKLTFDPAATTSLKTLSLVDPYIALLVGPEGGLTATEIAITAQYQFTTILLGPRILRTETAALTALAALQMRFGDLA